MFKRTKKVLSIGIGQSIDLFWYRWYWYRTEDDTGGDTSKCKGFVSKTWIAAFYGTNRRRALHESVLLNSFHFFPKLKFSVNYLCGLGMRLILQYAQIKTQSFTLTFEFFSFNWAPNSAVFEICFSRIYQKYSRMSYRF